MFQEPVPRAKGTSETLWSRSQTTQITQEKSRRRVLSPGRPLDGPGSAALLELGVREPAKARADCCTVFPVRQQGRRDRESRGQGGVVEVRHH